MKFIYHILIALILIGIASCSSSRYYQSDPEYSNEYTPAITYQQFYNDLSLYGNWINYPGYGYAWVPAVANFRPYYTNGQWIYTNYGWTWRSNYNWGWAPFHYGRWIEDRPFGWIWIPGTEWAPAWVSWRGGGDYYGWAPLGPGMNANISIGSIPHNYWTFVPRRYINSPRINNYYVNQSRNLTIINNTTIINNNIRNTDRNRPVYNPGPPVREVERTTGSKIREYNVIQDNKPGATEINNSSIRVFRPTVNQPANSRPEKVADLNQIRTTNQNNPSNTDNKAPIRQFPKDQTPQINRNEPPVNNRPSITPDKNNTPSRVFQNRTNNQPPAERNPDAVPQRQSNTNTQPLQTPSENQDKIHAPVRTFPNRNTQPPPQKNPDPVLRHESDSRPQQLNSNLIRQKQTNYNLNSTNRERQTNQVKESSTRPSVRKFNNKPPESNSSVEEKKEETQRRMQ